MLSAPLLSVQMGFWEEAVFAGSEDGRIFEIGLLSRQARDPSGTAGNLSETVGSSADPGAVALIGHTAAVNSLAMTSNGCNLISGEHLTSDSPRPRTPLARRKPGR